MCVAAHMLAWANKVGPGAGRAYVYGCVRIHIGEAGKLGGMAMKLGQLGVGKRGRIVAVGGEGILRRRLLDMGLTPRTTVEVRKMAPMGDPIEITVRGYELTLRKDEANRIEITPWKAED